MLSLTITKINADFRAEIARAIPTRYHSLRAARTLKPTFSKKDPALLLLTLTASETQALAFAPSPLAERASTAVQQREQGEG
jgi:hypothetical protein